MLPRALLNEIADLCSLKDFCLGLRLVCRKWNTTTWSGKYWEVSILHSCFQMPPAVAREQLQLLLRPSESSGPCALDFSGRMFELSRIWFTLGNRDLAHGFLDRSLQLGRCDHDSSRAWLAHATCNDYPCCSYRESCEFRTRYWTLLSGSTTTAHSACFLRHSALTRARPRLSLEQKLSLLDRAQKAAYKCGDATEKHRIQTELFVNEASQNLGSTHRLAGRRLSRRRRSACPRHRQRAGCAWAASSP